MTPKAGNEGAPLTAAVVGASSNPERFSNKAVEGILAAGWKALPVNPAGGLIHGVEAAKSLDAIKEDVHTVTLYVNEKISSSMADSILKLKPKRVIFNPGAENEALSEKLDRAGIETIEACTLIMLREGQF